MLGRHLLANRSLAEPRRGRGRYLAGVTTTPTARPARSTVRSIAVALGATTALGVLAPLPSVALAAVDVAAGAGPDTTTPEDALRSFWASGAQWVALAAFALAMAVALRRATSVRARAWCVLGAAGAYVLAWLAALSVTGSAAGESLLAALTVALFVRLDALVAAAVAAVVLLGADAWRARGSAVVPDAARPARAPGSAHAHPAARSRPSTRAGEVVAPSADG